MTSLGLRVPSLLPHIYQNGSDLTFGLITTQWNININYILFQSSLTIWSTTSFPSTPECAGTQQNLTTTPSLSILYNTMNASNSRSLLLDLPDDKLFNTDRESEHTIILTGCNSSTHWKQLLLPTVQLSILTVHLLVFYISPYQIQKFKRLLLCAHYLGPWIHV